MVACNREIIEIQGGVGKSGIALRVTNKISVCQVLLLDRHIFHGAACPIGQRVVVAPVYRQLGQRLVVGQLGVEFFLKLGVAFIDVHVVGRVVCRVAVLYPDALDTVGEATVCGEELKHQFSVIRERKLGNSLYLDSSPGGVGGLVV